MEYYGRLHDSEEHPVLTVNTQQDCSVREEDFQNLFGGVGYDNFLSEERPEAYMDWFGPEDEGESCSALSLKCTSLDDTAFEVYGLRTEEGEGFSRSNLTLQNAVDPVPVLLGNEYKGLHDPIRRGRHERCGVIGFLYYLSL